MKNRINHTVCEKSLTVKLIVSAFCLFALVQTGSAQSKVLNPVSDIADRVMNAYLYKGDKEKAFTSTEYFLLWQTVNEYDKTLRDEVGLFDYDHWHQAQDFVNPQVQIVAAEILSPDKASVKVCITDVGRKDYISFPMVYERGDWYIDDFMIESQDSLTSEKAIMRQYILENNIKTSQSGLPNIR